MLPPDSLRPRLEGQAMDAIVASLSDRAQAFASNNERASALAEERAKRLNLAGAEPDLLEEYDSSEVRSRLPVFAGSTPMSGQLQPATVLWFYSPPYGLGNKNTGCSGNPDTCGAVGNASNGTMDVALGVIHSSANVWGWAGVGLWYEPKTMVPGIVEFRALLNWTYRYALRAGVAGQTAHSRGEVGVRVFSWDSQGGDQREINDSHSLWSYGVDIWDFSQDAGDEGHTNLALRFPYDLSRHYACYAYVFAACDGGGWPSSQATVKVMGGQPWLVTEEWGFNP